MEKRLDRTDGTGTTALVSTLPSSVVQRKTRAMVAYGRRQPYIFCTLEEGHAIIAVAGTERDQLLLRSLWETGARVSEVIALRHCDIGEGYLLLPNLKQRVQATKQIVLNPSSDLCLKLLLYCQNNGVWGTARLFGFSKEWAERLFSLAATKAGVYKPARRNGQEIMAPAWPHCFRHSNAHHLARAGVPGPVIRDNLGHSSLQVTSRYLEFTDQEKREMMKRAEL